MRVLTMLLALLSSLLLVFLLDWVGGRVLLYLVRVSLTGNIEIRSLISLIWMTSIIQSTVLALPCLAVGGLLAWRQGYLETRPPCDAIPKRRVRSWRNEKRSICALRIG